MPLTLREVPSDADVVSQQLMLRAGLCVRSLMVYIVFYLWAGEASKIEATIREEMDRSGAQKRL